MRRPRVRRHEHQRALRDVADDGDGRSSATSRTCSAGWSAIRPSPNTTWRYTLDADRPAARDARQWMQLGTGPSGLTVAIGRMPDKEERIVAQPHDAVPRLDARQPRDDQAARRGVMMRTATTVEFGTRLARDGGLRHRSRTARSRRVLGGRGVGSRRRRRRSGISPRAPSGCCSGRASCRSVRDRRSRRDGGDDAAAPVRGHGSCSDSGSSGPQVLEGLHGLSFDRPLTRMRETIEIVRAASPARRSTSTGRFTRSRLPARVRCGWRPTRSPSRSTSPSLSPRMLRADR